MCSKMQAMGISLKRETCPNIEAVRKISWRSEGRRSNWTIILDSGSFSQFNSSIIAEPASWDPLMINYLSKGAEKKRYEQRRMARKRNKVVEVPLLKALHQSRTWFSCLRQAFRQKRGSLQFSWWFRPRATKQKKWILLLFLPQRSSRDDEAI